MPIYKGNNEIENVLLGSTQIETVYKGTQEVWNNNAWYLKYLGWVNSYNVTNLGITPSKLTGDNFITLGQPSALEGYCERVYSSTTPSFINWQAPKGYNSSSGVIDFYYQTYSRSRIVNATFGIYLLSHEKVEGATKVKDKNVIPLGWGTSFNIANVYPGYANLTASNFYAYGIGTASIADGPDVSGAGPVSGTGYISKSYNASTGILTFYNYCGWNNAGLSAVLIVP